MALDFAAGCVGGMSGKFPSFFLNYKISHSIILGAAGVLVGYPLDTVKVKIQTQDVKNGQMQYKGTFDCFFKLVRKDGVCIKSQIKDNPLNALFRSGVCIKE